MSKIVIIGNIIKDVYLNLDSRYEDFERDAEGTQWLNLGFNTSGHKYFRRLSNFGGAAISLEVLYRMGLDATISGSKIYFNSDGIVYDDATTDLYRYILVSDGQATYLSPSFEHASVFEAPSASVDYLFVDRSTKIFPTKEILSYLKISRDTKLVIHVGKMLRGGEDEEKLIKAADLIFAERDLEGVEPEKVVRIFEDRIVYNGKTKHFKIPRLDLSTHLSSYSLLAATILGGIVLGRTIEEAIDLARVNVSNAPLNASLNLSEMEEKLLDHLTEPDENLELLAANLVYPGKGILAADESGGSIKKKFASMEIEDTFDNRRDYRNLFFTTPDLEKHVNGVILFDETARQLADNGQNFIDFLTARMIMPGIKVDQGLEKFPDSEETWTKGLGDLPERLAEYYEMGLRFAKWRAAFNLTLDENGKILTPTDMAIEKNAEILAEYALDCQNAGIVPIVEPELVYDGYYTIEQSAEMTGKILDVLFEKLREKEVLLPACVLKVNMVLAGKKYDAQSTYGEVGAETARVLKEHVPKELAGVVFLSGGQTPEQATENLKAVVANGPFPWPVTFSFARALQDPALFAWRGDNKNADKARQAFLERLKLNSAALKEVKHD